MPELDFFCSQPHYIDHMAPIWKATDVAIRGSFFVPDKLEGYADIKHDLTVSPLRGKDGIYIPIGTNPILVAGYLDLVLAFRANKKRPIAFMEHGVGITFNDPGYAGGRGYREKISLLLAPNEYIQAKSAAALPDIHQEIIGTPKLDHWAGPRLRKERAGKPTVAISFHWPGKVAPEGGTALKHYRRLLPELVKNPDFTLIGHGHPRYMDVLRTIYSHYKIEVVDDFEEVMERADLYINDCSSTLYEFCVTGKPVIILNAPQFRRNVNLGIRFWDYIDIGPVVDEPEDLERAIYDQLANPNTFLVERQKMVWDLYPYFGKSAQRASDVLKEWING